MLAVSTERDDILLLGNNIIRISRDNRGRVRLLIDGKDVVLRPDVLEHELLSRGWVRDGLDHFKNQRTGERRTAREVLHLP